MRATLNIPDEIIAEVQEITGEKTKTGAIVAGLKEFIRQKRLRELIDLAGKIEIDDVTEELEELEMQEMRENNGHWNNS